MSGFEEIKKGYPFPIGEGNTAFSQYFIDKSYLSSLSTEQDLL